MNKKFLLGVFAFGLLVSSQASALIGELVDTALSVPAAAVDAVTYPRYYGRPYYDRYDDGYYYGGPRYRRRYVEPVTRYDYDDYDDTDEE